MSELHLRVAKIRPNCRIDRDLVQSYECDFVFVTENMLHQSYSWMKLTQSVQLVSKVALEVVWLTVLMLLHLVACSNCNLLMFFCYMYVFLIIQTHLSRL